MASVYRIEDSGPTTTINFEALTAVNRKIIAQRFNPIALPDNEGVIIPWIVMTVKVLTFKFIMKDIPAGDTVTDQRMDLEDFFQSGGDSKGLFIATFDTEDSTDGSNTESVTGKMKTLTFNTEAGESVSIIKGEFEFWEATE